MSEGHNQQKQQPSESGVSNAPTFSIISPDMTTLEVPACTLVETPLERVAGWGLSLILKIKRKMVVGGM